MKSIVNISLVVTLVLLANHLSLAQNGKIRGTVYEDATGLTLMSVNILVEDLAKGTATDLDGNYSIDLPAGKYKIRYKFISFAVILW